MTPDRSEIRHIVEQVVDDHLLSSSCAGRTDWDNPHYAGRELITEKEILAAHRDKRKIVIAPDAIVTPSARDAMARYKVAEESPHLGRQHSPKSHVAIGADHCGFELKESLKQFLAQEAGIICRDMGTFNEDAVDYPDFAAKVAREVEAGRCCRGIIIDGGGKGSAMVANKFRGIRAAHCGTTRQAQLTREHNDANILTLAADDTSDLLAQAITAVFLKTDFGGGRHLGRVNKIIELER